MSSVRRSSRSGELLDLGFLSLSAVEASGSVPEATVTGQYRGVTMERHSVSPIVDAR